MYSNFITPPDLLDYSFNNYTVLLIDPTEDDVSNIALLCKNVGTDFDVYIYLEQYNLLDWLETAFNKSDTVLINTSPNSISPAKDKLVQHHKAMHYGPKRFFKNDRYLTQPTEFFIKYVTTNIKPFFDM